MVAQNPTLEPPGPIPTLETNCTTACWVGNKVQHCKRKDTHWGCVWDHDIMAFCALSDVLMSQKSGCKITKIFNIIILDSCTDGLSSVWPNSWPPPTPWMFRDEVANVTGSPQAWDWPRCPAVSPVFTPGTRRSATAAGVTSVIRTQHAGESVLSGHQATIT